MTIPLHEHATGATIPAAVTNGAAAARMSTRYGMIDTAQVIAAFAENLGLCADCGLDFRWPSV